MAGKVASKASKATNGKVAKGVVRYVLVGCGGRGTHMFGKPLAADFPGKAALVGLFDLNAKRMKVAAATIGNVALPQYTDFDEMLVRSNCDVVVVSTRDASHAGYIVRALRAGKRVISEKPLCVNAEQCRQIVATQQETGGSVFVTHNARYGAAETLIHKLIREGAIGRVITITFHELLDRRHGADYFRRWHRIKSNSGGLLIHKASHHFDLLNWWAGSKADQLSAQGGLEFYGAAGPFHGPRCSACPHAKRCAFHIDLFADADAKAMYLQAESEDGYVRDGCVFDPGIDIEDHASVHYRYQNGIRVTYSLHAFSPLEGYIISFEGTEGRLEYNTNKNTKWAMGSIITPGLEKMAARSLRLIRPSKGIEELEIPTLEGSHGGADPVLRDEFFGRGNNPTPTERMAPLDQAVQAVLVGAAANVSIATGQPVRVQDLLKD
jgi:predicted dehydrogenase